MTTYNFYIQDERGQINIVPHLTQQSNKILSYKEIKRIATNALLDDMVDDELLNDLEGNFISHEELINDNHYIVVDAQKGETFILRHSLNDDLPSNAINKDSYKYMGVE